MEKIILAHYINIDGKTPTQINEELARIREVLEERHPEILHFIYGVKNQETRIDCLNPKLTSPEDFEHAKSILEKNQKIVTRLLSQKMGL
jgi:hypothetical protein